MHRALRTLALVTLGILLLSASEASAQSSGQKWVTSWTGSVHGPYPLGFPSLPPEMKFAIPDPAKGAEDQTFRLIVKPDLWASRMRLRFSNVHGTRPLVLDGVYLGVQASAGNLVRGTNRPVTFDGGKKQLTVAPGALAWSDPVELPYAKDPASPTLAGRKLAVSFHVVGTSGPMTWHAKAIQTSYVSAPKAGALGGDNADAAFPYTTASWFFLDAIDVMAPADTAVVVCFGDSITDGTGTTMNGDDRYPDALSRRLHDAYGVRVSVVNAGIGGNRVVGPADYDKNPIPGGPGSLDRLDRDVLQLSGVTAVIWMEGINDFGAADTSAEAVIEGYKQGVARLHAKGIKVIGGTLTSALNSTIESHGRPVVDQKRQEVNRFIREGKLFDAVADFDAATLDASTGGIRPEFQPNSTAGGPGDKLHPNRAGYAAMANTVDITTLVPKAKP